VLVHNEGPRSSLKLAVVEEVMRGGDGRVWAPAPPPGGCHEDLESIIGENSKYIFLCYFIVFF